ncbi:glutamate 5-kinase [Rhodoblastus sphagnicola]|uniref:Glutamate 5-kinase n=1 Tax=Rhodoblastus sphagnicola TaxID=333368 RepID=A0A2S6N8K7_9HYPH|nr:glutamate 5-kinase [Rhodoblastus sphagnicola]MBB4199920.1 glutamate 5-kinase [Rhodoblastus sphagnicola]PPQ30944.1 glutamate 5-kinase [Rhodoblastus sphagnicola]
MFLPSLHDFKRIVVKVGSSLLVDSKRGAARRDWLHGLADDLAGLHRGGTDILVVSSGAIALGRSVLGLPHGALRLEDSQAAASVGQIALSRIWAEAFAERGIVAGQILVTWQDTEERRRYLNARETLSRLLVLRAAPVINENDTVATGEIRYGDNDRLAARVATMASADLLILLSDITGLYDAPPANNPDAQLIPVVPRISAEIEAMAGGAASELSRGGMRTKIEAAKIATSGGAHMVIADGRPSNPVGRILQGDPCTWFLTPSTPVTARKKWIAGSLAPQGVVTIDDGAARALASGASLLPAGVTAVEGDFCRGDSVIVRDLHGGEIGRGLVGYDVGMARKVIGRNSRHIAEVLGVEGRTEMIHRDDLVLAGDLSLVSEH